MKSSAMNAFSQLLQTFLGIGAEPKEGNTSAGFNVRDNRFYRGTDNGKAERYWRGKRDFSGLQLCSRQASKKVVILAQFLVHEPVLDGSDC